jgi:hypothetical protein
MTSWRTLGFGPQTDTEPTSDRRAALARRFLQLALVLLIIGLIPGLLALWSQRRASAAVVWRNPADNIHVAALAPDLALLSLAGVPDDQTLALAMEKSELATVHAILALSTDLSDARRTSGWLWLAHNYQRTDQSQQAVQAYYLAGSGAVMGTDIHDLLRAEILLAVGLGLTELHDRASAPFFLEQAATIAAYSPRITPYHRRSLLERVVPASLRAGGERDAWRALTKAVKSGSAQGGNIAESAIAGKGAWQDTALLDDSALVQAGDARRAVAAEYLEAMIAKSGTADEPMQGSEIQDAKQALRSALLNEDAAVERHIEQYGGTQESRHSAQQVLMRWLLLKRRIAAGGFGSGLVPEWESNREAIDAALAAAWTEWLALQTDTTAASLGGDFQALPSGVARQATMAAFWGLYPDAPIEELVARAQSASGSGRLRLAVLKPGTPPVVGWSE